MNCLTKRGNMIKCVKEANHCTHHSSLSTPLSLFSTLPFFSLFSLLPFFSLFSTLSPFSLPSLPFLLSLLSTLPPFYLISSLPPFSLPPSSLSSLSSLPSLLSLFLFPTLHPFSLSSLSSFPQPPSSLSFSLSASRSIHSRVSLALITFGLVSLYPPRDLSTE